MPHLQVSVDKGGVESEANVTEIHEALHLDQMADSDAERIGHFGIFSIKWSPNGREIAAGTGEASVLIYDMEVGKVRLLSPAGPEQWARQAYAVTRWSRQGMSSANRGAEKYFPGSKDDCLYHVVPHIVGLRLSLACMVYMISLLFHLQTTDRMVCHHDDVNAVAYLDDSPHIIASGSDDHLIKV